MEFMDRLAALIPPPRRHRHRYYGVLAPNLPLRPAVTALAAAPEPLRSRPMPWRGKGSSAGRHRLGNAAGAHLTNCSPDLPVSAAGKCGSSPSSTIDRGEEAFLTHLGEPPQHPYWRRRGPPLMGAAGPGGADDLVQPFPEFEFDQRIAWWGGFPAVRQVRLCLRPARRQATRVLRASGRNGWRVLRKVRRKFQWQFSGNSLVDDDRQSPGKLAA